MLYKTISPSQTLREKTNWSIKTSPFWLTKLVNKYWKGFVINISIRMETSTAYFNSQDGWLLSRNYSIVYCVSSVKQAYSS